jgi:hypothetical protein
MEATYDEISDAADALALAMGLDSDHIATIIRTATARLKETPCPANTSASDIRSIFAPFQTSP